MLHSTFLRSEFLWHMGTEWLPLVLHYLKQSGPVRHPCMDVTFPLANESEVIGVEVNTFLLIRGRGSPNFLSL